MTKPSVLATIGAATLLGCGDDLPPIEYETERVAIGSALADPLCPGDVAFLDQHVGFVERMLDVNADLPIEVYLFDREDLPCRDVSPFGCYDSKEKRVLSTWGSVDHEIAHAVSDGLEFDSKVWFEGVATALHSKGTHYRGGLDITGADLDSDDVWRYTTVAGHFVRWLIETEGVETVRDLLSGENFEDVYGASKDDLAAAFESEAPYAYPWWDVCPFPEIPESGDGEWFEELSFSCESDEARQTEWEGTSVVRTLALDEGTYSVRVDGGLGVVIIGCQIDVLEEPAEDHANGDVRNQAEASQTALGTFYEAGEDHILHLADGLYRLALSSGVNEMTTLSITVRRQ